MIIYLDYIAFTYIYTCSEVKEVKEQLQGRTDNNNAQDRKRHLQEKD